MAAKTKHAATAAPNDAEDRREFQGAVRALCARIASGSESAVEVLVAAAKPSGVLPLIDRGRIRAAKAECLRSIEVAALQSVMEFFGDPRALPLLTRAYASRERRLALQDHRKECTTRVAERDKIIKGFVARYRRGAAKLLMRDWIASGTGAADKGLVALQRRRHWMNPTEPARLCPWQ